MAQQPPGHMGTLQLCHGCGTEALELPDAACEDMESAEEQNKWPRFWQPMEDEGSAGATAPHTRGWSQGIALRREGSAASWEEEKRG